MNTPETLLQRLDEIGRSLAQTEGALALLGFGSVGQELERLDQYSDLDFFAIARPGYKSRFISELDWLSRITPIAYAFQNTTDGYKLLFDDGIFCEFAVFEPEELARAIFSSGRLIWQADDFDVSLLDKPTPSESEARSVEWLVGEVLTNLYVGLGRYHRGEKLSAVRFIQGHAVDRVIELAAHIETAQPGLADVFDDGRRFERRFPQMARQLPQFVPGYNQSLMAARAILDFLNAHFAVNPAIEQEILILARMSNEEAERG